MLTLLLIRHAESIGNQQRRMQGRSLYPLSDHGRHQAHSLGQRLASGGFARPTHVYFSPLLRARATTQIILEHLKAADPSNVLIETTIQEKEELAEGDAGIFEGLTWSEAQCRHPDLCLQLETSHDWVPIPEAESPQELRKRAELYLQWLLAHHQNGDRVWMVTHEWILCHLLSVLLGSDRTWKFPIAHTGLFEWAIDRSRWDRGDSHTRFNSSLWQVRRFNDTAHLLE